MVIIIKCLAERIKMPDYYSDPFFFWTHNYSNYLLFGLFIIRTDYCSNEINSRTKNYSSDKSVITHKYIINRFWCIFHIIIIMFFLLRPFQVDDSRRRHNYEPFIATFLGMMAEQGHLSMLLEQQQQNYSTVNKRNAPSSVSLLNKKKKKFKRK